jgi:hypothetical protein
LSGIVSTMRLENLLREAANELEVDSAGVRPRDSPTFVPVPRRWPGQQICLPPCVQTLFRVHSRGGAGVRVNCGIRPRECHSLKSVLQLTDLPTSTRKQPRGLLQRKGGKCKCSTGFIVLFFRGCFSCNLLVGGRSRLGHWRQEYSYQCNNKGQLASDLQFY